MTEHEQKICLDRLSAFYTADEAERWLLSQHPQLDGRRPIDCSIDAVLTVIDRLESGAYL